MGKPALVIMAKVPSVGGKSRLKSVLSPAQREELQWAFLKDILDKVRQIKNITVFLALTPKEQINEVKKALGGEVRIISQPDGDLGERMCLTADRLFEQGFQSVLIVGSDIPTLSPHHLTQALQALQKKAAVLGPTADGGYYLIGMSRLEKKIFAGINWGTGEVLRQTLVACQKSGLSYSLLPPLADIDRPEDLLVLQKTLTLADDSAAWFPRRTADFLNRCQLFGKEEVYENLL